MTEEARKYYESLKLKQLLNVCEYYEIVLTPQERRTRKAVIDRLVSHSDTALFVPPTQEVKMSVRVQRAYESMKKE